MTGPGLGNIERPEAESSGLWGISAVSPTCSSSSTTLLPPERARFSSPALSTSAMCCSSSGSPGLPGYSCREPRPVPYPGLADGLTGLETGRVATRISLDVGNGPCDHAHVVLPKTCPLSFHPLGKPRRGGGPLQAGVPSLAAGCGRIGPHLVSRCLYAASDATCCLSRNMIAPMPRRRSGVTTSSRPILR